MNYHTCILVYCGVNFFNKMCVNRYQLLLEKKSSKQSISSNQLIRLYSLTLNLYHRSFVPLMVMCVYSIIVV